MKKRFIEKIEKANTNNFTSEFGLKFRKISHRLVSFIFRIVMKYIYKKNVIVDSRVKLEKNKAYIFAANHSFFFDGPAVVASNDRNCYALFGATEQLHLDFRIFFIWLSGIIYVNRFDKISRKESVLKMNRVLKSGNSILIFPEGRWNDTESKLCQKLFAGPYNLSVKNKVEVVPISLFNETNGKNIYVTYGRPLKLYEYNDKDEAIQLLRDNLATLYFEQIMAHSTPLARNMEEGDIHFTYMNERMNEYKITKWSKNYCWNDELFEYKGKDVDLEDLWKDIDKVNITPDNSNIFGEILVELEKRKKYNFTEYMNKNYEKNNKK